MKTNEIIDQIKMNEEKPFVTERFGDNWQEHTKKLLEEGEIDIDSIIHIAWKQGRRAILLERELRKRL